MIRLTRLIAPLFLALGFALAATAAEAAPGTARTTAAVYTSASTSSKVVDTLKKGTRVIVIRCTLHWCYMHHVGPDGWMLRSQLYNPYYGSRLYFQFPPYTPVPGRNTR
jgi:SH3-like domain-containing protein